MDLKDHGTLESTGDLGGSEEASKSYGLFPRSFTWSDQNHAQSETIACHTVKCVPLSSAYFRMESGSTHRTPGHGSRRGLDSCSLYH